MTDRELLELAAKAAGLEIIKHEQAARDAAGYSDVGLYVKSSDGFMSTGWNPIKNDGDALRLAVSCGIEIESVPFGGRAIVRDDDDYGEQFDEESPDRMSATRRAIVRAAAAIARQAQGGNNE